LRDPERSCEVGLAAVRAFEARRDGQAVTAAQLEQFAEMRVFGYIGTKPFCTCPQYVFPRGCYHTLAVGLLAERVTQPAHTEGANMSVCHKGNKRRAAPRTAAAPPPDERDVLIRQLQEELGQLRGDGAARKRPAASSTSGRAEGLPPPSRRRTGKCAPVSLVGSDVAHIYVYQPVVGADGKVGEAVLALHLEVPRASSISSVYNQIASACGQDPERIRIIDQDLGCDWYQDDSPVGGNRRVLLRAKIRGG